MQELDRSWWSALQVFAGYDYYKGPIHFSLPTMEIAEVKQHPATAKIRNLPWVEKYRPQTLNDLISHQDILSTIQKFISEDRLPHLLLYGPPGTGKTSTILACAKQLYKDKEFGSMVLELNASDDRGIDIVRGPILSFASTRTIFKKGFKLVILDEADAMTQDAQNALRRVIEKFTENTRFCLICNYLSKIIPALQSRCTRFRFGPLTPELMVPRLEHVIKEEKVDVSEDGMKALVTLSSGDMRRALNILQSTNMAFGEVTEETVYTCTGHPLKSDIANILDWMLNQDFTTAYRSILFESSTFTPLPKDGWLAACGFGQLATEIGVLGRVGTYF